MFEQAASSPEEWRRLWRRRGLAVDHTLPQFFSTSVVDLTNLRSIVPKSVVLPGGLKQSLTGDDVAVVEDAVQFVASYIAEFLPFQILTTDIKKPKQASALAVKCQGGQDSEYLGSFDMLMRVWQTRAGIWRPYHERIVALDVKLTGYHSVLGLNGPTMRAYVEHGRAVVKAAKSARLPLGDCAAVAYLIQRPSGTSSQGQPCKAAFGFVAFDTEKLLAWDPKAASSRAPPHITLAGSLLQTGRVLEPESLPPAPMPARPRQRDRWHELANLQVKRGWVRLIDFAEVFEQGGPAGRKQAGNRVGKRLRDAGYEVQEHIKGVGHPPKIARVADLKALHGHLQ